MKSKEFLRTKLPEILVILIPFLVYILHVSQFSGWIVDDAGISFAFSRNLAYGYGLVPQPGSSPVECYSNFTWVALFSPFFLLHHFNILTTPKLVSLVLVLLTFTCLPLTIKRIAKNYLLGSLIILTFLAINTPFVVWNASGMENPLYTFLIVLLFFQLQLISCGKFTTGLSTTMGVTCALIALTRPDGILYVVALPAYLFFMRVLYRHYDLKSIYKKMSVYIFTFLLVFGSYLAFRINYFGELFPNTYFAKGGPSLDDLRNIILLTPTFFQKLSLLTSSIANEFGNIIFLSLSIILIVFIGKRKFQGFHIPAIILFIISILVFILLPKDWMGEFRFATPFYVFFYTLGYLLVEVPIKYITINRENKLVLASLIILVCLSFNLYIFIPRTQSFANNPVVPYSKVASEFGDRFNKYAKKLGLEEASFLVPDIGGTLFTSQLKVYDLGGLCDVTIARSLGKDQQVFYDYIFDTVKPTFIHTHFPWNGVARLDDDPRFRNDYVPIQEVWDNTVQTYSGDYVRKDAVIGKPWKNLLK